MLALPECGIVVRVSIGKGLLLKRKFCSKANPQNVKTLKLLAGLIQRKK